MKIFNSKKFSHYSGMLRSVECMIHKVFYPSNKGKIPLNHPAAVYNFLEQ